jgi:hypothetical protein
MVSRFTPGKEPLVFTGQDAVRTPETIWTTWRGDKSLFLPGFEAGIVHPVRYAILAQFLKCVLGIRENSTFSSKQL